MTIARDHYPKLIADKLHELASKLKTRTRAHLTDANHSLEAVMQRFFNALYGWNLIDLNTVRENFPGADLGDRESRVAMQITNEGAGKKIVQTHATAVAHGLGANYSRLIIFFLLEKKPAIPKAFVQSLDGPVIECLDITDLLLHAQRMDDLGALKQAASVLEEELRGDISVVALDRYLTGLHEYFSTYENLGLPSPANEQSEKDVRVAIRDLFVEPACTPGRVSPEEFDAALMIGKNPADPLLPILAGKEQRIVLLADPGMGKSTLIQWLISTLAEKASLPKGAVELRGAIPLPFILRDLVRNLPKDLAKWDWPALLRAFTNYHPRAADRPALAAALTGDEAYFRTLLASDRAFFLIDGLDELGDPEHRRALRNALWEGFEQYPSARWLITSRWVGYEDALVHLENREEIIWPGISGKADDPEVIAELRKWGLHPQNPETFDPSKRQIKIVTFRRAQLLYLAPFDDEQQRTFANHWYLPRMGEALGAEHAGRFVEAVRRHSAVRVIGRVPNLLYLLALLYRHRAMLPHGRTHVYTAISEAYLGGLDLGIDAARGSIDAAKRLQGGARHGDKVRLLATIARHMQERRAAQERDDGAGAVLVTRSELEQWLTPHFLEEEGCAALHAFISYVAARSGLLLPRGDGIFSFAHLSFQEYYAACWLEEEFRRLLNADARGHLSVFLRRPVTADSAGSLTRKRFGALAAQPAWREPLIFLVEMLSANPHDIESLIAWLYPQLADPKLVVGGPERMPIGAARLLAAISLNPHAALILEQRKEIWAILWDAYLVHQSPDEAWHVTPALLAGSEYQAEVWAALPILQPKRLSLRGCTGVTDLMPLAGLSQLEGLSLDGCRNAVDLYPVARLTQLRWLSLDSCPWVTDLSHLANLTDLNTLSLVDCKNVADLSSLAGLTQLRWLSLDGCTAVTDLTPLIGLAQLLNLFLHGCTALQSESLAKFCEINPKVKIHGP